jgi:lipopolysaccharide export system permease protein
VKTLHLYLTRQIVLTLMMTVMVFTFVLLLIHVLKEVLSLLVNQQVTLLLAGEAIGLLIPFLLVFALPMGMLTAALLVFGRFSADNELTAARASGVSLISLITPVLLLSCLLSLLCAGITMYFGPQSRVAYKRILWEMGVERGMVIPEKTFIKDLKDHIIYVGSVKGSNLEEVLIFQLKDQKVERHIKAAQGIISIDASNQVVEVTLMDGWVIGHTEQELRRFEYFTEMSLPPYTNAPPSEYNEKIKLTDMSFSQLRAQIKEIESRLQQPLPSQKMTSEELRAWWNQMNLQKEELIFPLKMQIHRQVSFSFACIAFTLVSIPLGIRAHRRETMVGVLMALILVTIYYSFFFLGLSLEKHPEYCPQIILWIPNLIFQLVGGVLLWRANRGI